MRLDFYVCWPAILIEAARSMSGFAGIANDHILNERLAPSLFLEVGGYNEPVVLMDLRVVSLCKHHMLPVSDRAHVGYLSTNRVVGISELARVVRSFARRLQIQEKLATEIADTIQDILQTRGVGVVIEVGAWRCTGSTRMVQR